MIWYHHLPVVHFCLEMLLLVVIKFYCCHLPDHKLQLFHQRIGRNMLLNVVHDPENASSSTITVQPQAVKHTMASALVG